MNCQPGPFFNKFDSNGFELLPSVINEEQVSVLLNAIGELEQQSGKAGRRNLLSRCDAVRRFAISEHAIGVARAALGAAVKPVRAIYFDKTPEANWYVTWHQDLAIAVTEKKPEITGWGPWSVKDGVIHVQPPSNVLESMISLRFHLDNCPVENGAIKFIAGSHLSGVLTAGEIDTLRDSAEPIVCAAALGDVIAMRPLILHSSSVSTSPEHRRVLHIEYAAFELPYGLHWAEA